MEDSPRPMIKPLCLSTRLRCSWREALRPPKDVLRLPFTSDQEEQAHLFVSLLVCVRSSALRQPRIPRKRWKFASLLPASLVRNLFFVEGFFGNAGDPYVPQNDAALDIEHWTGHTGCVILAPHLVGLKKKALGLPHWNDASERQRRDGMCWKEENEIYNGGGAFKVACRDGRGIMVTIIADNYYGYCKKEVKTQISFSANLYGIAEEEHSGGALTFPSYILGQEFHAAKSVMIKQVPFSQALHLLGDRVQVRPEGYAIDNMYANIYYVPENTVFSVRDGSVKWSERRPNARTAARRRRRFCAAFRLQDSHAEAAGRSGVASDRFARGRHALS